MPPSARLALFVALAATLPLWTDRGDLFGYGVVTLIYILLALGLNVVVGCAGLLDLGYVAFFGFGAYIYALLSSDHSASTGRRVVDPARRRRDGAPRPPARAPVAAAARRLPRDRDALLRPDLRRLRRTPAEPDRGRHGDLTGGPNGIADIDPLDFFGYELVDADAAVLLPRSASSVARRSSALHFLNESRTGRAWRALREDPLAAELMSMPVNRLKLLAFVFGAGDRRPHRLHLRRRADGASSRGTSTCRS